MKFEVGKKYRHRIETDIQYECIWADQNRCVLKWYSPGSKLEKVAFVSHSAFRGYIEVKPKIKVEKWIAIRPDGRTWNIYDFDPRDIEKYGGKIANQVVAILHIKEDVEEGQGM